MFKRSIFLSALALALATPGLASADQGDTSPLWGTTDLHHAFGIPCATAGLQFVRGVTVEYGAWVDRIHLDCQNVDSTRFGATTSQGGSGGPNLQTSTCPVGEVVTGILPLSGSFFDGGNLHCNSVQSIRRGDSSSAHYLGHFGGPGGSGQGFFECPAFHAVTGMHGNAGNDGDQ